MCCFSDFTQIYLETANCYVAVIKIFRPMLAMHCLVNLIEIQLSK